MHAGDVSARTILGQVCHAHISSRLSESMVGVFHTTSTRDGSMTKKTHKLRNPLVPVYAIKESDIGLYSIYFYNLFIIFDSFVFKILIAYVSK